MRRVLAPVFGGAIALAAGAVARAEDVPLAREALIARLVTNGSNIGPEEDHAVEVIDCTLVTYRWKKEGYDPRKLWTSFRVDMTQVGETSAVGLPTPEGAGANAEIGIVFFRMREGQSARFEKPVERPDKIESLPSPRKDRGDYYYDQASDFSFVYVGPGTAAKAEAFVAAFEQYRLHYCFFAS